MITFILIVVIYVLLIGHTVSTLIKKDINLTTYDGILIMLTIVVTMFFLFNGLFALIDKDMIHLTFNN